MSLPAMISFDPNGLPFDSRYRDVYKSRAGAMAEAREVFVAGADVVDRWRRCERFTLLELGFGLGVNFLATLAAWRGDALACRRLHYVSIEAHLVEARELERAHAALGVGGQDAHRLLGRWPMPLPGLHRIEFADARVTLTIAIGDVHQMLPRIAAAADAIYLDGFSPARNPAMWDEATCRALARHARPGARLATYTAASPVREALSSAGFEVSLHPGFADKRECLRATYAPRWRTFPAPEPAPSWPRRELLVIGAGLAGCATAAALAGRGWRVQLLDRHAGAAQEGSAQTALADHPHLSPDDNLLSRLTRAALMMGRAENCESAPSGSGAIDRTRSIDFSAGTGPVRSIGRLALGRDAQDEERLHATVARLGFPAAFLRPVDREEASALAGLRLRHGGAWLPLCRAAEPARLCEAWLRDSGVPLAHDPGRSVQRLERRGDDWIAMDARGDELGRAPVVALAAAGETLRLADMQSAQLRRVRGQTTLLHPGTIGGLRTVLGGDAYACPLPGVGVLAGATFDDDDALEPTSDADRSNLRRLARLLAPTPATDDWADAMLPRSSSGPVGFRYVARDRIPLIGALPDERRAAAMAGDLIRNDRLPIPTLPGVYGAFAYGSRGLLWAMFGAQVLAAMLEGEPSPVESDLIGALDPARFLRQRLRRARRRD